MVLRQKIQSTLNATRLVLVAPSNSGVAEQLNLKSDVC